MVEFVYQEYGGFARYDIVYRNERIGAIATPSTTETEFYSVIPLRPNHAVAWREWFTTLSEAQAWVDTHVAAFLEPAPRRMLRWADQSRWSGPRARSGQEATSRPKRAGNPGRA
jgi:hypothetical protein